MSTARRRKPVVKKKQVIITAPEDVMRWVRFHHFGAPIAAACGIDRRAVHQWILVPANRVLTVERVTGISRYKMRPDVYGKDPLQ